jgi:hypothetical protein
MLFVKSVRTVMIVPQGRRKHKIALGLAHLGAFEWRNLADPGGKLHSSTY